MWQPIDIPARAAREIKQAAQACCNNIGGKCLLLDCDCVQAAESRIVCRHFLNAVVPAVPVLNEDVTTRPHVRSTKRCCNCGSLYKANSNRQQYCPDCQPQMARKKAAERKRRSRAA